MTISTVPGPVLRDFGNGTGDRDKTQVPRGHREGDRGPRAVRRGDEHRTWTSVPLRDALFGGLGLVSTSGPITPQHGTRDRRNSRWP